ncbi:O-antigen ligase family protein [Paenibacillus sp. JCM 10914]
MLIAGWLGVACIRTGLYFDLDLYMQGTALGILLLLWVMVRGTPGYHTLELSEGQHAELRLDPGLLVILSCISGLVLIYIFHSLTVPLSLEATLKEIVRWGMYGFYAATLWLCSVNHSGRNWLKIGWHAAGTILCGTALLAVYGLVELPYGIYHTASAEISATGARLGGLLQYPNTFGAVMAAFLLERLFAVPSVLKSQTAPLRAAAALLPLLPYTAALLLTESRGAWIAAALACAAGLARERRAIAPLLVAAAAPLASAALLYRQLAMAKLAPATWPGLLWLAGLWAGGVLAGLLLHRWRRQAAPAASGAAALLVAAAVVTLLAQLQERMDGATLGVRRLMYSDAWQLAKSSLWLGHGGETWRQSYLALQSQPYVGAQVHSGYMDILLNTGIIGLAIILALIIYMLQRLSAARSIYMPAAAVLSIHAIIDFDWSFGIVWLLLLWLSIMGLSEESNREKLATQRSIRFVRWRPKGFTFVLLLCLIVWSSLCAVLGMSELNLQLASSAPPAKQSALLKAALRWNPANVQAAIRLSASMPPAQRIDWLRHSLAYAPSHPGLSWELAESYARTGQSEYAAHWFSASLLLDRFQASKQTQAIVEMASLSDRYWRAGAYTESAETAQSALDLLRRYRQLAIELSEITPLRNDRDFRVTRLASRQEERLKKAIEIPVE